MSTFLFPFSFRRHLNFLFLSFIFLLYLLAELIIYPAGNFPVNDDWWYFRFLTGDYFNYWPCHSFVGYYVLYKAWLSLFSESYFTLRVFSLLLGFLNIVILNRICARFLRIHPLINFFTCLTFLFHPVYLSLCNSGMTEMVFIFYMLAGVFFYLEFLMYQRFLYCCLAGVCFVLMILTRQVGLSLLLALLITDILINREYVKYSLGLFITGAGTYAGLEFFLMNSDFPTDNFPFFIADQYFFHAVERKYFSVIFKRWTHYLTHAAFTLSPITGLAFLFKYKTLLRSKSLLLISAVLMIPAVFSLSQFPVGNYLNAGSVGPLNIPESYISRELSTMYHKDGWYYAMVVITVIFTYIFLLLLCYQLTKIYIRYRRFRITDNLTHFLYFQGFAIFFFLCYYGLMTMYDNFFDRYILIPQIFFVVIFLDLLKRHFSKSIITVLLLIFLFLLSTLSVHDYFSLRRKSYALFESYLSGGIVVEGFIEDKARHWLKNKSVTRLDPVHPDETKYWIDTYPKPGRMVVESMEYVSFRNFSVRKIMVTRPAQDPVIQQP